MATTTPAAVLAALRAAVLATPDGWRLVEQPDELVNAQAFSGFRVVISGSPRTDAATGLPGVQLLRQAFAVELYDDLQGDPAAEDPVLLEKARRVADQIDFVFASYPDGVELVQVDDRGTVERYEPRNSAAARVRILAGVLYQAEIG